MVQWSKGQQEAVSAVLISGILIGVVGSVYFWGVPLIQKNQDVSTFEQAETFMRALDARISFIANNGGRDAIALPGSGRVDFTGSAITYTITTDGTIYAADAAIPLTGGGCDTTEAGVFGADDATVLCATSTALESHSVTTYSLSYRPLESGTRIFSIALGGEPAVGSARSIVVERTGITTTATDGTTSIAAAVAVRIV